MTATNANANAWVEIAGHRFHTHDAQGRQYVRLTFKAAGAKRKRTTWAVKLGPGRYLATDKDGDAERGGGKLDGKDVTRIELILTGSEKVTEKAAGYSFTYGELDVLPTTEGA